jgi:ABC-type multidrug transport system ATPase subunit
LNDLNFQARNGEFVALLGPNGAGKTTFLRILASLMRPNFGECELPTVICPINQGQRGRISGLYLISRFFTAI